jgi:hypothetical protein
MKEIKPSSDLRSTDQHKLLPWTDRHVEIFDIQNKYRTRSVAETRRGDSTSSAIDFDLYFVAGACSMQVAESPTYSLYLYREFC